MKKITKKYKSFIKLFKIIKKLQEKLHNIINFHKIIIINNVQIIKILMIQIIEKIKKQKIPKIKKMILKNIRNNFNK